VSLALGIAVESLLRLSLRTGEELETKSATPPKIYSEAKTKLRGTPKIIEWKIEIIFLLFFDIYKIRIRFLEECVSLSKRRGCESVNLFFIDELERALAAFKNES
jgi:hypothetical protein